MVNLYRFCIAILFVTISFSYAQMCSISLCKESTGLSCIQELNDIYSYTSVKLTFNKDLALSNYLKRYPQYNNSVYRLVISSDNNSIIVYSSSTNEKVGQLALPYNINNYDSSYTSKELFCSLEIDPKPDLTNWNNCKSGKDHGFSWITIGDAQGEGESRYKQEFWACDDPDIWITYNHPPESGGTADPNTPSNPNDDGKNGEDGDSGSGKGDNTGSENGSDNGNAPTGNGNGKGLSQSEVQQVIENALDSKGKSLEGKINQWWLSTQGEMEKEGLRLGHEANSLLDSGLAGLVNEKDINQLDRTYRFQLGVAKTCPEPYVLNLGKYQIPIPFDIFCQFAEIMGYLVIASAYMSAIYIVMGLRK